MNEQLERDIEAAARVPLDIDTWNDNLWYYYKHTSVRQGDVTIATSESLKHEEIHAALCAAPHLAAEVKRLREQWENLTKYSVMTQPDIVEAVRKCGERNEPLLITANSCMRVADALDELLSLREELAQLKGRRCGTCEHWDGDGEWGGVCRWHTHGRLTGQNHCCSCWEEINDGNQKS